MKFLLEVPWFSCFCFYKGKKCKPKNDKPKEKIEEKKDEKKDQPPG